MTKPPASKDPLKNRVAFRNRVTGWFKAHGHEYPWRKTRDPYAILVSEIMLQQTQVATVLNRHYFTNWLKRFPDAASLASASEDDVLRAWEGLGYYRRARNLQAAARQVVDRFGGVFPATLEGIAGLPGVGRYTAGAVASFASNFPAPIVDANVARLFARIFDFKVDITSTAGQKQLWQWAEQLLPAQEARLFNSGLMELGQRICGTRQVECRDCPVAEFCKSPDPLSLPKKKPRAKTIHVDEHAVWVRRREKVLLEREAGPRRKGLWKLPNRSAGSMAGLPVVLRHAYGITHHRVSLIVYEWPDDGRPAPERSEGEQWFEIGSLGNIAIQSPHRKALTRLLSEPPQTHLKF